MEDIFSITNVLCLVLQTDKKDVGATSRAVSNCIKRLEEILTNKDTDLLKSFNSSCSGIVKTVDDYQMQLTVSGSTRKEFAEDRFSNDKDQICETVVKLVSTLIVEMKGAFDMSDILIVLALMRLDPISVLEESDLMKMWNHLKRFMSFMEMSKEANLMSSPQHVIINCNEESLVAE